MWDPQTFRSGVGKTFNPLTINGVGWGTPKPSAMGWDGGPQNLQQWGGMGDPKTCEPIDHKWGGMRDPKTFKPY